MKRAAVPAALAVALAAAAPAFGADIAYEDQGGRRVADQALDWLGAPYRTAGTDAGGFDCSGLVYAAYEAAAGETLPRTVTGLIARGERIQGPFQPGDLLFFDTTGGPSHVGIALGAKTFVHAASEGPQTGVIISSIDETYYRTRFLEARRLLPPGPGRFVIRIDGGPVRASLASPVAAGTPLEFAVGTAAEPRRAVTVRALVDGKEVLERRLSLSAGREASVWLVPGPGRWTVAVEAAGVVPAELSFESGAPGGKP